MKALSKCVLLLISMFFCVFIYGSIAVADNAPPPQDLTAQVQPAQPDQPDTSVTTAPSQDTGGGAQVLTEIIVVGMPGTVTKVHDGDTFNANLNVAGCPDVFCKNMPVRIHGIDAAEIGGSKCAQEKVAAKLARDYLASMITGKTIDLRDVHRDKYFRVDASVFVDGVDVGQKMIDDGYARAYLANGKRSGWCDSGKMT